MAVHSFIKEFHGKEKEVHKKICALYKNSDNDVYLFHDIVYTPKHGKSFRPDFIILDPKRGICIVEVKSYTNIPVKIDETEIYFKNGKSSVSPIVQARGYFFKLKNYLEDRGIDMSSLPMQPNLIIASLKEEILGVNHEFLNVFYKGYKKSLSLDKLFSEKKVSIDNELIAEIKQALNSTYYFKNTFTTSKKEFLEHEHLISKLDKIQDEIVNMPIGGHHLIKGIPGSGKSVAAIARAVHIIKNQPEWRVLVLSVNRNLADQNKKNLIERVKGLKHFGLKQGSVKCTTLMDFLGNTIREKVSIDGYEEKIAYYKECIKNQDVYREWDYVIIDEYQDFNLAEFEIIKSVCKKHKIIINKKEVETENIFLVGDKLQQLKESIGEHPWKDIGISIVGRTKNLKVAYRSSAKILDFSLDFLMNSSDKLRSEVENYYEGIFDVQKVNNIDESIALYSGSETHAINEVHSWISDKVNKGVDPRDILIIHPDSKKLGYRVNEIFHQLKKVGVNTSMPSKIKGIESKYVVIWMVDRFKMPFDCDVNKIKKIYMSMTRASLGLCIYSSNESNYEYLRLREYFDKYIRDKNLAA